MNVQAQGGRVPVHSRVGVEYDEVLDDVLSQLKEIAKAAGGYPNYTRG